MISFWVYVYRTCYLLHRHTKKTLKSKKLSPHNNHDFHYFFVNRFFRTRYEKKMSIHAIKHKKNYYNTQKN